MKDLLTYLNTYENVSFEEKEFTEIDAMILVQLSYLNYEKIIQDGFCNVRDILGQVNLLTEENYAVKRNRELFERICKGIRYKELEVGEMEWKLDDSIQYAAMTFRLGNSYNIIYRGTDLSIAGWKEDLNLGISETIDSHSVGLDYANHMLEKYTGDFYLLGHSKGGNIALYVGMRLEKKLQDKILKIFDFDGPGFIFDLENDPDYHQIQDRYFKFVPKDDVIGLLLNHSQKYQVVDSRNVGFIQHDLYFWKIEDSEFKKVSDISILSKIFSRTILDWLASMTQEEKISCIQTLDELFKKANISNLNQLKSLSFDAIKGIIYSSIKLSFKQKKQLASLVLRLMKLSMKASVEEIRPKKNDIKK